MSMCKFLHLFISLFFSEYSYSYWQQKADYDIDIIFDHKNHQFTGKQSITYFNHSNDTLHKIFIHLYFNAFQPGSMMDIRSRSLPDPDRRVMDRISKLSKSEIGFHQIQKIQQDSKDLKHHIQGTVLEVDLIDPLLPNNSSIFYLEYFSQVPIQIRRSGRDSKEGIDYSMAQWFPKIAGYDKQGWHAHPYIAREFYSPWGNYDVSIKIDKKYIVGATGELNSKLTDDNDVIWNFKAEKVHDFVWAADPDYTHDILSVPEINLDLHFYYQANSDEMVKNWKKLQKHTADAFLYFNKKFGEYPYGKYSVIQGGDGGMEYPMATLITGERSYPSLLSVTLHEALHSWYQMVLATNESYYAWMDEGFTSYTQTITQFELFNDIYDLNSSNPLINSYERYFQFLNEGTEEALTTHSDHFSTNRAYGVGSYTKGAIFLSQLGYIIGEDLLFKGLRRYYNEWKFRHPDKNDFIRVMEKVSGLELDWYLDYWIGTTHQIDYSLELKKNKKESLDIEIIKNGTMPMPIDIEILFEDNSKSIIHIPLSIMRGEKIFNSGDDVLIMSDWEWVNKVYPLQIDQKNKKIKTITIDSQRKMADVNPTNNIIEIN